MRAIGRHQEQAATPADEIGVGVGSVLEHPLLDPKRGDVTTPRSDDGDCLGLVVHGLEPEAVGGQGGIPQPATRREDQRLQPHRPDCIPEVETVAAVIEAVAAGELRVAQPDREVGPAGDGSVLDGPVGDFRSERAETFAVEGVDERIESDQVEYETSQEPSPSSDDKLPSDGRWARALRLPAMCRAATVWPADLARARIDPARPRARHRRKPAWKPSTKTSTKVASW